jgi:hypothetical protein
MLTHTCGRGVLLVLAAALAVAGCSGDPEPDPAASSTGAAVVASPSPASTTGGPPSGAPVTAPGPAATGPTGEPTVAVSLAPAVKIGEPAKILDDVRVEIGQVKLLTVKAEQPGEVAGSAAAVAVTVRNRSGKPFSLTGLVVTASYHDGLPGNETTSGPSKPLTGSLATGRTAKGTYVFMVPRRYAGSLRLEISSNESPTIVQFKR